MRWSSMLSEEARPNVGVVYCGVVCHGVVGYRGGVGCRGGIGCRGGVGYRGEGHYEEG